MSRKNNIARLWTFHLALLYALFHTGPTPNGKESEMTTKFTKEKDLTAGILYCLVLTRFDYERNEDYDSFDALVYWNGYEFINERGDRCNDPWDYVIAQSEKPDPQYISEPQTVLVNGEWIDVAVFREQSLAQWRAECAARGVVVGQ